MPKPTIVMIHGFRGTHHGLELIAKNLRDEFETVMPDLPGFGEGPLLPKHDLEHYVDWLRSVMMHYEKPILLGHSFGSIITAEYAARYPDTIEKLVLVNPISTPALEGPQRLMTKLAIFYYWLGKKLPARPSRAWLSAKPIILVMSAMMAKTNDRDLRKFIHEQHLTYFSNFQSRDALHESFVTSVSHNVKESAPRIKVPTLLIVGDQDDIAPLKGQHELLPLLQNADLKIITGVGHLTHYEKPNEVADFVKDFVHK